MLWGLGLGKRYHRAFNESKVRQASRIVYHTSEMAIRDPGNSGSKQKLRIKKKKPPKRAVEEVRKTKGEIKEAKGEEAKAKGKTKKKKRQEERARKERAQVEKSKVGAVTNKDKT